MNVIELDKKIFLWRVFYSTRGAANALLATVFIVIFGMLEFIPLFLSYTSHATLIMSSMVLFTMILIGILTVGFSLSDYKVLKRLWVVFRKPYIFKNRYSNSTVQLMKDIDCWATENGISKNDVYFDYHLAHTSEAFLIWRKIDNQMQFVLEFGEYIS